MKIKRYDQYIKESKKINEFRFTEEEEANELPEGEDMGSEDAVDDMGGIAPETDGEEDIIEDTIEPESEIEFGEEEEGGQYIGQKMIGELADRIGGKVMDNAVLFNGKKINFFSETEMFHVDGKKFKTVDEVIDYLSPNRNDLPDELEEEPEMDHIDELEEEPVLAEKKSYRQTRKFESYKKKK